MLEDCCTRIQPNLQSMEFFKAINFGKSQSACKENGVRRQRTHSTGSDEDKLATETGFYSHTRLDTGWELGTDLVLLMLVTNYK